MMCWFCKLIKKIKDKVNKKIDSFFDDLFTIMTITTRTTELEAVNTILSTIGEAPLSTLTGSLPVDGTTAKNILNEISREVQSAGWHFNTQYKVDLTRDTDNKVPIGTDVVRVQLNDKYDKSSYDVVQRGSYLFNLAKNSNIFDQDFTENTLIYLLQFDDIPEQARRYITIRSARVFHDRTLGANTLHKFSSEDEARSLAVMKQAEMQTGDNTIFDNYLQSYTVNR